MVSLKISTPALLAGLTLVPAVSFAIGYFFGRRSSLVSGLKNLSELHLLALYDRLLGDNDTEEGVDRNALYEALTEQPALVLELHKNGIAPHFIFQQMETDRQGRVSRGEFLSAFLKKHRYQF